MIIISILIIIMAIALPFRTEISPILISRITTISLFISGALSLNALYIQSIGSGINIYSGLFHVSIITQLFDTFILIIGGLILTCRPIINYLNNNTQAQAAYITDTNLSENEKILGIKYSLIILFSILGSLLLVSSSDLVSMYLSIELQSFGVYILTTLYRDSKNATSAALKYFLLGGFSSSLILLGSAIAYTYTGLTNLEGIYSLSTVSITDTINYGLTLGIIIIIVGYLFKIAAAPLHNWAPDVYDETPTIITIWLTIMPKISILIFILNIYLGIFQSTTATLIGVGSTVFNGNILENLLLISSLLSLIIGSIVGLAQVKIKRLLAYSTISHVGFILLALAISTEQSIESFIFYIIQYSLTNLNTFFIIIAFGYLFKNTQLLTYNLEKKDINYISELRGLFTHNPILSISLAICLFSMAGIPPLLGFFSKQMVLYSAIQNGYYFMALIAIIVSVISASYYLKVIRTLFTENSTDTTSNNQTIFINNIENNLTSVHSFIISTLTLIILSYILKPSILLNSTQLLSLSIFNC